MDRKLSDEELDAILGEPKHRASLDDVHDALIQIQVAADTQNEILERIAKSAWGVAFCAGFGLFTYLLLEGPRLAPIFEGWRHTAQGFWPW
jgi:hypothetical protein